MIGSKVTFNGFTINDRVEQPLLHAEEPYYYILVNNVDGLRNADISYESHPIPNAVGERSGDVFRRGKTITLSGYVYALNLARLEEGCDYLQQMFTTTALSELGWTRISDEVDVYIRCRINQDLSIIEGFQSDVYRNAWVVGLRADLPYTYRASDDSIYPAWQA